MAYHHVTTPSGRVIVLTPGEGTALKALLRAAGPQGRDGHVAPRPSGVQREIMYRLYVQGILERRKPQRRGFGGDPWHFDDDDTYAFAVGVWSPDARVGEAERVGIPPTRTRQQVTAAAVRAGWHEVGADADRYVVDYQYGTRRVRVRYAQNGRVLGAMDGEQDLDVSPLRLARYFREEGVRRG